MSDVRLVMEPVTLTRKDAAAALGVSVDFFEEHVQAELRLIRRGRLRLVPVDELRRWVQENAESVL
jgi:excisionase family DNA binding protein